MIMCSLGNSFHLQKGTEEMQLLQRFWGWWRETYRERGIIGKISFGCLSLLVVLCLCGAMLSLLGRNSDTPQSSQTPAAQSASPTIVPSETVEPTVTQIPALLPSLFPPNLVASLEERGFVCNPVERGELYFVRTCEKDTGSYLLRVDIYGRELFLADLVEASILQFVGEPSDELTASFLGFMATIPYDGATPQRAQEWVESTIPTLEDEGDARVQFFGGVKYRLVGTSAAMTLEIGDLPDLPLEETDSDE